MRTDVSEIPVLPGTVTYGLTIAVDLEQLDEQRAMRMSRSPWNFGGGPVM